MERSSPIRFSPRTRARRRLVRRSRALQFDGSSYGSMTRLIQDDFTIEAWINTGTTAKGPAFSDGSAIAFADVETVMVDDFATGLVYDKFVISIGGPDTSVTSTSAVVTNQWVHVAATRTRATGIVLVFVNGVLEGSAVANKNSLGQATEISLGGRSGRNFYVGLMAEVRLWRTARSEARDRGEHATPAERQRVGVGRLLSLGRNLRDDRARLLAQRQRRGPHGAGQVGPDRRAAL